MKTSPARKRRTAIPRMVKEQVLKEYRHLCAICSETGPQVHHIDEDPENNDSQNLIPLCPNHHLRDQHDPTAPLDQGILRLFRKYKDPAILTPQFYPLFKRMQFLKEKPNNGLEIGIIEQRSNDLLGFVETLNMGRYYAAKLGSILQFPIWIPTTRHAVDSNRYRREFVDTFPTISPTIEALVVEMLRYQGWQLEPRLKRKPGS